MTGEDEKPEYILPEDDLREAEILFAEIITQHNDDKVDELKIVQFKRTPFMFGAITIKDGRAVPIPLTKEDLEQALYNCGKLATQTTAGRIKGISDKLYEYVKRRPINGVEKIEQNEAEELGEITKISKSGKEDNLIVVVINVLSLMILGYFVMLYFSLKKTPAAVVI